MTAFLTVLITVSDARPSGGRQGDLRAVARKVFGARAGVALCIAHFESTDGRYQYNGPNRGPWQINTAAHPWVDGGRLVSDWLYSAQVAYRISKGGTDWSPWSTHRKCGV